MLKFNLKDYYYFLKSDIYVEVDQAIIDEFNRYKRAEHAYKEKVRRHKAYYSLDYNDGIENSAIRKTKPTDVVFYEKELRQILLRAINTLPKIQADRIIMYFYYDMSFTEIAKLQDVHRTAVSKSIAIGLKNLKKILEKTLK